ncbi:MAG: TetR/AcrR family transcriptional regulator [Deltaproteobacteria bacterium]|nr:TetR/AcrR family transcriptional regulator [Deltaproteobacteria bacterium]
MANRGSKEKTRNRIIESAKKLFAEQGYQKTTVMDISRQAGVSEAALYEHFQGKEDLLLTIPDLWVSDLLSDLEGQLFGIKGAVNKLRKYLWWYMRRIEEAPLDAKVVYLILKTNANFMQTEVYSNVRSLYSYLLEIFEEGRATGEMGPDLHSQLARDIFVGTVDHLITRWLLKEMSYSLFEHLEEIFDLMVQGLRGNREIASADPPRRGRGAREKPNGEGGGDASAEEGLTPGGA